MGRLSLLTLRSSFVRQRTRRQDVSVACFSHRALSGGPRPAPKLTEEGILIHQASPYTREHHLVWGTVLWDAGVALSKFFAWNEQAAYATASIRSKAVLELGAGTGVVGLTLCSLGAGMVTLTDSEPEVLDLLRQNVEANGFCPETVVVRELDWADPTTFLAPVAFDLVVAADVLYSRKDRWFVRALTAHLGANATAVIACPPRTDSPLSVFFELLLGQGFIVARLENSHGQALGTASGMGSDAYDDGRFVVLTHERCCKAAKDAPHKLQIFRVSRC